jgi:XTP/dITP diphosphohydrolase
MQRLLIATTNPGKLAEYRILLAGLSLEPVSLEMLKIAEHPHEAGETFRDNALIKARFYFARSGIATLADDGGLEVDALDGAPGVHSHRWLGDGADERALAEEVIRRMRGIEANRRSARIRVVIALVWRDGGEIRERVAEGAIEGVVAEQMYAKSRPGLPYRAVLYLPKLGRYLAELGDEEEARISHRKAALEKLRPELSRIADPDARSSAEDD